MRRLIAGLLVCLTVCLSSCSPAMAASTTDSQLDFDNDIMPLSAVSDFTFKLWPARYDISSDTFYNLTDSSIVSGAPVPSPTRQVAVSSSLSSFDGTSPYYGFKLSLVFPDGVNNGKSLIVRLNSFMQRFYFKNSAGVSVYPALNPSSAPLVRSWANVNWSGTGKYTSSSGATSWRSVSGFVSLPVTLSFSNVRPQPDGWTSQSNRIMGDYVMNIDMSLPDTWTDNDGDVYEVTSSHADDVALVFAFDVNPSTLFWYYEQPLSDKAGFDTLNGMEFSITDYFFYADGRDMVVCTTSTTSSGSSAGLSGLQQSIGNLSQNLTGQISQLKTTIQQGANEVKNEIKSQTQTLTDKLTDVKDDIVGGITDLKETTTQGFKDVVQGITDLPGKIGEMLQGLIVPDSEKVSGKFEDFNNLAEEKLGVIYQVPEMVISMGQSVVSGAVEQKGEMTLPKFEIIMPATNQSRAGERLTVWEEYTFPIWPEGTEVIHTAVQTATSLICVIAMINSIKRKYEEWLEGK